MLNYLFTRVQLTVCAKVRKSLAGLARAAKVAACAVAVLVAASGCDTTSPPSTTTPVPGPDASSPSAPNESTNSSKSLVLQEGDTIKVAFPGAPNLDTIQSIRRDGKITLEIIGEYDAAGKTPAAMEAELKKLYGSQLVNNEVSVTVQSSAFVIYVIGAVGRPGKIVSERPLSPMEALIEAGLDNTRSNLKAIQVIRTDNSGHTEKYALNLYKVLHKKTGQMPSFTLKPYDIIDVPERFNFF